jgi:hypothetical protein
MIVRVLYNLQSATTLFRMYNLEGQQIGYNFYEKEKKVVQQ